MYFLCTALDYEVERTHHCCLLSITSKSNWNLISEDPLSIVGIIPIMYTLLDISLKEQINIGLAVGMGSCI